MNKYVQIAKKDFGFEQAAELKIALLEFLPEVRGNVFRKSLRKLWETLDLSSGGAVRYNRFLTKPRSISMEF